ncbi:hypothetical protein Tco_0801855 [Tanacetum coccineum]|uniref:Retrovirus-related Pol polyprotein from transposon TNT 1-94-like beta-barrel domain-containing protein n=1 Tax=Tanacetum coccineum TaxID=301880 RepID=A0ABQ5A1D3_9ASTR
MTQTVPSKSTANVTYQGTARSRVPQAVLSRSTDGSYYPRMDNRRPRISSYSPLSRSSNPRTTYRPQRPKKTVKSIWVKKGSTVGSQAVLPQTGNPEEDLKDYAIIDSGCSGSMTGDKDKLSDFKEFKGGYVAFGNDSKGGRISGKGTIKTSCLDFEKVSYVEELKFNLLSVSQICDKKHNVLFSNQEDVLWMQNQLLDYGFNFMNTEIHIDNESTICIVKNPVFHSKTKHIQIRHHFIRDCYEQRLINVVKVHTDDNVADLLTKGFDLARFNFLVVTIGMMNP